MSVGEEEEGKFLPRIRKGDFERLVWNATRQKVPRLGCVRFALKLYLNHDAFCVNYHTPTHPNHYSKATGTSLFLLDAINDDIKGPVKM